LWESKFRYMFTWARQVRRTREIPKLEDHHFSAIRDSFLQYIRCYSLYLEAIALPLNLNRAHFVVIGSRLAWGVSFVCYTRICAGRPVLFYLTTLILFTKGYEMWHSSVTSLVLSPSILLSTLFRNTFSACFPLTWPTRHQKLDVLTVVSNFCFLQCISLTCILKVNWLEIQYCLSKHFFKICHTLSRHLTEENPMCSTGSPVWNS
jgi:hypothetical protein